MSSSSPWYKPSKTTAIVLGTLTTFLLLRYNDSFQSKRQRTRLVSAARRVADAPLLPGHPLRKIIVFLSPAEGDLSTIPTKRFFKQYIKPVWDAAAVDYELVECSAAGDVHEAVCDHMRTLRRTKENKQQERVHVDSFVVLGMDHVVTELIHGMNEGCFAALEKINIEIPSTGEDATSEFELKYPSTDFNSAFDAPVPFPAADYIQFKPFRGWSSLPWRIVSWFTDYQQVEKVGLDALRIALNGEKMPFTRRFSQDSFKQDFDTLDNRVKELLETWAPLRSSILLESSRIE